MIILKKIVPTPLKVIIKTVIDWLDWVRRYRKIPIVLENKYNIKFVLYPWNSVFMRLASSSHDHIKEFSALEKLVKPGSTIFDVGANVGIISVFLSQKTGNAGTVHSFEPVTETYGMLTETIALNRCKNILPHQLGLSDTQGVAEIYTFDQEFHTLNSLGQVNIGGNIPTKKEEIQLDTIDNFCIKNNIHKIELLKIDVEGFEDSVIKGARNTLKNNTVRYIQFEISEMPLVSINKNSKDIFNLLHGYGYSVYRFDNIKLIFEGPIFTTDNNFDNYYASKENLNDI